MAMVCINVEITQEQYGALVSKALRMGIRKEGELKSGVGKLMRTLAVEAATDELEYLASLKQSSETKVFRAHDSRASLATGAESRLPLRQPNRV